MSATPFHRPCPVCAATAFLPHWQKGELRLVRCGDCGMIYANPAPPGMATGEYYDAAGADYYLSPAKLESDYADVRFARELQLFRKHCACGAVLDVGCSSGAFLFQLQKRWPGDYEVLGTDVSGAPLDYAESRGVPVVRGNFLEQDFGEDGERGNPIAPHPDPLVRRGENSPKPVSHREPRNRTERRSPDRPVGGQDQGLADPEIGVPVHGEAGRRPGERFAAITFWAVLEHLAEPKRFLEKAHAILKPGGLCFVLVPNGQSLALRWLGAKYRYVYPQHLNYFTADTLIRLGRDKFAVAETRFTHFNPVVLWQDWRSDGREVSNAERGELLKRTTAYKQQPWLKPVKALYGLAEKSLAAVGLADNLVVVFRKASERQPGRLPP